MEMIFCARKIKMWALTLNGEFEHNIFIIKEEIWGHRVLLGICKLNLAQHKANFWNVSCSSYSKQMAHKPLLHVHICLSKVSNKIPSELFLGLEEIKSRNNECVLPMSFQSSQGMLLEYGIFPI